MGTPFKHKGRLYGHMNRGISAIDYDPRLKHVLIGADDGACLVDMSTNNKIQTYPETENVSSVLLSKDFAFIA